MGGISKVVKGIGSVIGLGSSAPSYTIKQDPGAMKAEQLQANLGIDLANSNTPNVQAGGQVSSATDTLAGRRKRTSTGVSSNLGIGV
jgi:hypothetical protein